jgi:hypothetical protein
VAALAEGGAADEVAATDDDGKLHAHLRHRHALAGDVLEFFRVDAEASFLAEPFAGNLQQHAFVNRTFRHECKVKAGGSKVKRGIFPA